MCASVSVHVWTHVPMQGCMLYNGGANALHATLLPFSPELLFQNMVQSSHILYPSEALRFWQDQLFSTF